MNICRHAAIDVMVTTEQLIKMAECSKRMTNYADVDGSLLITIIRSQQGVPVRLILDKRCINNEELKAELHNSS